MAQTILHFVFTLSGGGCLVTALRKAGRGDPVVSSVDDLSFGPIDPPDARAKWAENELGRTSRDDIVDSSERVWNKALFPGHRKVAWMSRRSAREYAGFLDWLSRLDDTPCDVIDLTEVKIPHGPEHGSSRPPSLAVSVASLNPSTIRDNKLWGLAKPLEITERCRYLELWRQLRSENAALRVTDGDELMSAPISLFDELLMSCVTDNWQNVSRVFGDTFMSLMDDIAWPSDVFLTTRVNALVKDGRLEIRGNSERFLGEVRLPRAGG